MLILMLYDFNSINHPNLMRAHRSCGQFYGHFFLWLTFLSDPQTAGPHTSNPNQVGGTLCISIDSTALFGGTYNSAVIMGRSDTDVKNRKRGRKPNTMLRRYYCYSQWCAVEETNNQSTSK